MERVRLMSKIFHVQNLKKEKKNNKLRNAHDEATELMLNMSNKLNNNDI